MNHVTFFLEYEVSGVGVGVAVTRGSGSGSYSGTYTTTYFRARFLIRAGVLRKK